MLKKAALLEAEGRRNNWAGIQTPPNCKRRVDGGVLDPCSLWSRASDLESVFPPPSCLLPSAFPDQEEEK